MRALRGAQRARRPARDRRLRHRLLVARSTSSELPVDTLKIDTRASSRARPRPERRRDRRRRGRARPRARAERRRRGRRDRRPARRSCASSAATAPRASCSAGRCPRRSVDSAARHRLTARCGAARRRDAQARSANPAPRTVRISGGSPELAPQAGDVAVDDVGLGRAVPDLLDRTLARDRPARLAQQQLEQRRLAAGQLDRSARRAWPCALRGRGEIGVGEQRPRRRAAAGQRPDPRDQLLHRERLDQVVVGAGLEPGDAVGHGIARGQHQDRRRQPLAAQPAADREAVEPRHRHVEHDHVGGGALGRHQRGAAVGRPRVTSKPSAASVRSSIRRSGGSSSTTSTRSPSDGSVSHRRRRGAGTPGTPRRAPARRTARTPRPRGRSAPSRSACAAGPARR